jgi:L-rhamnose isomerase/sugar isomerase
VDEPAVTAAQQAGDVLGAHRLLVDAFENDVRPLLAQLREGLGVAADPVAAFRSEGHAERLAQERGTAHVESAYETA